MLFSEQAEGRGGCEELGVRQGRGRSGLDRVHCEERDASPPRSLHVHAGERSGRVQQHQLCKRVCLL